MKAVRKILGLLIVLLIGLPILFAIIWAVGITRAAVSPEFVSDLPQEIIEEVPSVVEEIFEDAQKQELISDENTRAWFKAASEVDVSPRELMRSMGLLDWLENEMSVTFDEIGDVLRGRRRAGPIVFNLRPLKEALNSQAFSDYMMKVIKALPPCDEREREQWLTMIQRDYNLFDFPACSPDVQISEQVIRAHLRELTDDMNSEIEIFSNTRFIPLSINRFVKLASYGLFLLPAFIILIGAVIAASSTAGFFRWSGLSILAGGLIALLTALFTKHLAILGIGLFPYSYTENWSVELHQLVIEKTAWIQTAVVNHLFSPVIAVAGVVSIVGFVIFVLSFIARSKPRTEKKEPVEKPVKKEKEPAVKEEKKSASEEKPQPGFREETKKEYKEPGLPEKPEESGEPEKDK
ncbi:MAG TPA: hypothetical protein VFG01_12390 [Acidobacteriota bacterium]|nr:hypothetical protein [Acidobacteriota bacterium]